MLKNAELIKAYSEGKIIECFTYGWVEWIPLLEMRDSALRAFLEVGTKSGDEDWQFRIKE